MSPCAPTEIVSRPLADAPALQPASLAAAALLWGRLEAMWRAQGARGPAPPRALLDVGAMRDFLDLVMLVDVLRDAGASSGRSDYRFRVYGTGLAQLYGADLTGWRVSALTSAAGTLHRRCFDAALTHGAAIRFTHDLAERAYARRVEGLCFPLTLSGATIDQLVAIEAPLGLKRAPAPYL
ncbi:MAG: PAS domain-containing protein [Marivibrio sp.]|uniref:PAS domain-containing protein n=1 Tax=Marivibrio sp. TaxID=2039719 RepID=UPI0032ED4600